MTELLSHIDNQFDAALGHAVIVEKETFGSVRITGADRLDLLHRMSTNDLLHGKSGRVVPTVFTTEKGRVIDFVRVVIDDSEILALVSPGNEEHLTTWLDKYCIMEDFHMSVATNDFKPVTCVGPKVLSLCEDALGAPLERGSVTRRIYEGHSLDVIHSSMFGTETVDLLFSSGASSWREAVMDRLLRLNVPRMERDVFDAYRISRGIPATGLELTQAFNPYEVNLLPAISVTKGCYIGQEVIARLDTYDKVQRLLVGFVIHHLDSDAIPPIVLQKNGHEVGTLTSLSKVSLHDKRLGLGVVRKEAIKPGSVLQLERAGMYAGEATMSELPMPLDFSREVAVPQDRQ